MRRRGFLTTLVLVAATQTAGAGMARAAEPPPPPVPAQAESEPLALPATRASEPAPERGTLRIRINGEYEVRQSLLTALPLTAVGDGPAHLDQTSRLFHWLRLRPLLLVGETFELRAEADIPRGMVLGAEPEDIPDHGTDFDQQQPVRIHARMLRATLRSQLGELSLGHTTTHFGMGLVDHDGDQPRFFGTPDRPATFERLQVLSGRADSALRVLVSGDALFEDGRLSLVNGDQLLRVAIGSLYAPNRRSQVGLFARYESLRPLPLHGGAQTFVFDSAGRFRSKLAGAASEVFGEYEVVYRLGDVGEASANAGAGGQRAISSLAGAARLGLAMERVSNYRRYGFLVASLEWGMASGDADPTDNELHRFVMNPNHAVGLILFSEVFRFKTSRAQALLVREGAEAGTARLHGVATGGGVAGASYLNPIVVLRPAPDLDLKLGGVLASASTEVVDPSAISRRGRRANYDGGSPRGRSLGTELDVGAELRVPLEPPMVLRLSLEGAVAFPGSAFADASGHNLGTQALGTAGLGITF